MYEADQRRIKDYVLVMMGYPACQLPLSHEQLNVLLKEAEIAGRFIFRKYPKQIPSGHAFIEFVKSYTLALTKVVVGRINQQLGVANKNRTLQLAGEDLTEEGKKDLALLNKTKVVKAQDKP